eukprot:4779070-Pleurochrysis_carterae.AAC.1
MLALAKDHTAVNRWPLISETHVEVSSRSAARANADLGGAVTEAGAVRVVGPGTRGRAVSKAVPNAVAFARRTRIASNRGAGAAMRG